MLDLQPVEQMVFTALEAGQLLRLDVGREGDEIAIKKAVSRLVEKGLLQPCMYRKERMFLKTELDRFLQDSQR